MLRRANVSPPLIVQNAPKSFSAARYKPCHRFRCFALRATLHYISFQHLPKYSHVSRVARLCCLAAAQRASRRAPSPIATRSAPAITARQQQETRDAGERGSSPPRDLARSSSAAVRVQLCVRPASTHALRHSRRPIAAGAFVCCGATSDRVLA